MEERDRQRAIRVRLAGSKSHSVPRISTGFSALDEAIEGGLPRGKITEVAGDSGTFKSTLALSVVAAAQSEGLAAAWIDAEHVFDPAYAARAGVSLERLPVVRADTAEELLEIARRLCASGGLDLLIIDSAAALTPAIEFEIGLGESGPGLQTRVLASGFRRLSFIAFKTETAVLVLNQIRSAGGADAQETSSAGPAVKLHSALRILLEPLESGSRARFRIVKNRYATPVRSGELRFEFRGDSPESL